MLSLPYSAPACHDFSLIKCLKEKLAGRKTVWDDKAKHINMDTNVNEREEETIMKCQICGLMITNLKSHMMRSHNEVESEAGAGNQIVEEGLEIPEDLSQEVTVDPPVVSSFKEGDIVLVQRKTLHWPSKILGLGNVSNRKQFIPH